LSADDGRHEDVAPLVEAARRKPHGRLTRSSATHRTTELEQIMKDQAHGLTERFNQTLALGEAKDRKFVIFAPAIIRHARLGHARLDQARLDQARLDQARLDHARLDHARLGQQSGTIG